MQSLKIYVYLFFISLGKMENKTMITPEIGYVKQKMVKTDIKWHNGSNGNYYQKQIQQHLRFLKS